MQSYFTAHRRQIVVVLVLAVGLYGLLPVLSGLRGLQRLAAVDWRLLVLTFLILILTYMFAAASYVALALQRLLWWPTFAVELAGLFINRVVPAGLGGLGLNFLYLRSHRHTVHQAASVTLLNNILGIIGNVLVLLLLLIVLPHPQFVLHLTRWHGTWTVLIIGVIVVAGIAAALQRPRLRHYRQSLSTSLRQLIRFYRRKPYKPLLALFWAALLALGNAACFWVCCKAVGLQLAFLDAYIISGAGVLVGSATPTPGGLGGVEAGTIGALVALGQPAVVALNATLIYRLMTLWIPMIVGAAATLFVRQQGWVRLKY